VCRCHWGCTTNINWPACHSTWAIKNFETLSSGLPRNPRIDPLPLTLPRTTKVNLVCPRALAELKNERITSLWGNVCEER
jgi:hypothetical protein